MSDSSAALGKVIRSPLVVLVTLAVVIGTVIWLVAFWFPQGTKLAKLDAKRQVLETQQEALETKLAILQRLKNSNLSQLNGLYSTLVPNALDNTQYIKMINTIVNQSGVKLITLSPPVGAASATGGVTAIPVALQTTGTYDQELALIQKIYALPRLTTIGNMSVTGGGPNTTRYTTLNVSFSMDVYESSSASSVP